MAIFGALLGGALSLLAGNKQSNAAKDAAKAQSAASAEQLGFAKQVYNDTTQRFQPFLNAGTNALGSYTAQVSKFDQPGWYSGQSYNPAAVTQEYTQAPSFENYTKSPGYDWQLSQGKDAALSAAGGSLSGATLSSLTRLGQGLAATDYANYQNRADRNYQFALNRSDANQQFDLNRQDAITQYNMNRGDQLYANYLSRLGGLVDMGTAAAGNAANAGANYLSAGTNAISNRGNAQAAGNIGSANAFSDALGNIVGGFGYQNAQGGTSGGLFGNLFSGNSWG
jgi:hypothetical protein